MCNQIRGLIKVQLHTGGVARVTKTSVGGVGGTRGAAAWLTDNKVFQSTAQSLKYDYFGKFIGVDLFMN